jgi:WD40 repeat protein
MKFSGRRRWTRAEKWLLCAPVLVGIFAGAMQFGPELVRKRMGWPTRLETEKDNQLRSLVVSKDGGALAACGQVSNAKGFTLTSGRIFLWDARTLRPLPPINTRPSKRKGKLGWNDFVSQALVFSPDGRSLGVQRLGFGYSLYDMGTRRLVWRAGKAEFAHFSPDGRFIALGSDGQVEIVRATDGHRVIRWINSSNQNPDFDALAWSPDGKTLACVGPRLNIKRTVNPYGGSFIQLRRVADGQLLRELKSQNTLGVRFSPDGKTLAAVAMIYSQTTGNSIYGATVRVFDMASGHQKWQLHSDVTKSFWPTSVCDAVFSPDGKILATMQNNNSTVLFLDPQTGKKLREFRFRGEGSQFYVPPALAFSPDGKRLFARGKDAVLVWDLD